MTFTGCLDWCGSWFLRDRGLPYDPKPCTCPDDDCPPLKPLEPK